MENKLGYAVSGLVVGVLLTLFLASYAVNGNRTGMMRAMGMGMNNNQGSMMDNDKSLIMRMGDGGYDNVSGMMHNFVTSLKSKNGDDFDRAFISEMIVHHQGAIDMAAIALTNAKHQEIKDLAKSIIDSQSKEVSQMKNWQDQWYK